jgi:putative drug exporter of the RND superfamily
MRQRLLNVLTIATHRRGKWVVAAVWLVVAMAAGSVASKFQDAQRNDPSSYLPGSAESSKALAKIKAISGGDEVTDTVVVYFRSSGLTPADRALIASERRTVNSQLPADGVRSRALVFSSDRRAALVDFGLRVRGQGKKLTREVDGIRNVVHGSTPSGLVVKVTGPGGQSYDGVKVFSKINGTLLYVTVAVVFLLLVLIYRSPIFWAIPLLAVGLAEVTTEGIGYALTQAGVTINGQTAGVLTVLVFGAGTDYMLLMVARYREELRRHEDRHEAMGLALRRAGPVIFASAMTVIAALLCLLAAEVNGSRGLGPIAAIGIAMAMLSALTLLPALLVIFGRRAFWPFIPRYGTVGADETHGLWRRIAITVDRRHRPIAGAVVVLLLVLCIGLTDVNSNLTQGHSYRSSVESVQGQDLVDAHFPAGATAPVQVVVPDPSRIAAVRAAVASSPGITGGPNALGPVQSRGGDSFFTATLAVDPSSNNAFKFIAPLRRAVKSAGGDGALVGGPTAQERDYRISATHDNRLIVPMIVLVVFTILGLLLRSLAAPGLLIMTVLFSYGAALGTGSFLFAHVFGFTGDDPSLVLFTFLFLVALGVDYNIFLMARVREETILSDTRTGVVRALAVTGAVITSAGIVLAATFSALASLPLVGLTEIGFVIAFGVLLDAFLVRTVLVPALVIELDQRVWWPSALSRRKPRGPIEQQREPELTGTV